MTSDGEMTKNRATSEFGCATVRLPGGSLLVLIFFLFFSPFFRFSENHIIVCFLELALMSANNHSCFGCAGSKTDIDGLFEPAVILKSVLVRAIAASNPLDAADLDQGQVHACLCLFRHNKPPM